MSKAWTVKLVLWMLDLEPKGLEIEDESDCTTLPLCGEFLIISSFVGPEIIVEGWASDRNCELYCEKNSTSAVNSVREHFFPSASFFLSWFWSVKFTGQDGNSTGAEEWSNLRTSYLREFVVVESHTSMQRLQFEIVQTDAQDKRCNETRSTDTVIDFQRCIWLLHLIERTSTCPEIKRKSIRNSFINHITYWHSSWACEDLQILAYIRLRGRDVKSLLTCTGGQAYSSQTKYRKAESNFSIDLHSPRQYSDLKLF